jgi:hypothetical protein
MTIEGIGSKFITAVNDIEEYSTTTLDPNSTVTDFLNAIQGTKLDAAKAHFRSVRMATIAIANQQMLEQWNDVEY